MSWTPEPGEKCYVEADDMRLFGSAVHAIPHDIVDVLEAVTVEGCVFEVAGDPTTFHADGDSTLFAALECLVKCNRLERVVEGDAVTARYRRKT